MKRDLGQKRILYTRDIHMWKETYVFAKRPIFMKKDPHVWEETWDRKQTYKRETYICGKRPLYVKRDLKKKPAYAERDLYICGKKPIYTVCIQRPSTEK